MRFVRHTFDVDAQLVGNESADIIGGKDFSRSRCLLTPFQARDGHDKAPESVKHRQWTMKSAPQCGSGRSCSPIVRPIAVMHQQIVEADRQFTGRYVASRPQYWTMWIGRGAGGTDQAAGC